MPKKLTPATAQDLENLKDPVVLAALATLKKNNWLELDVVELKAFFNGDAAHPAYQALEEPAKKGGKATDLVMALIGVAILGAILHTALAQRLTLEVFVLWGSLGALLGGVAVRNPLRIFKRKN